jgi:hypothetical protein
LLSDCGACSEANPNAVTAEKLSMLRQFMPTTNVTPGVMYLFIGVLLWANMQMRGVLLYGGRSLGSTCRRWPYRGQYSKRTSARVKNSNSLCFDRNTLRAGRMV